MKIGNLEVYGVIYKITNKVNGKVYIGQTTHGFNERYKRKGYGVERVYKYHLALKNNGYRHNHHLLRSIEKYGFDNFEVCEIVDIGFSYTELNIKEQIYIDKYDSFKNGYNRCLGGDGARGYDGLKGADNPNSKSVVQLSLNGEFIKIWDYIGEVEKTLNISHAHISSVCNHEYGRKSCGGYMWVYLEEYNSSNEYKYNQSKSSLIKKVYQLSLKGDLVGIHDSLSEASRNTGIDFRQISSCLNKYTKSAKGYQWVFEDEYDESKDYTYKVKRLGIARGIYVIEGESIKEFKNISQVKEYSGYGVSTIVNMLNGKNTRIKDMFIIYKDKYTEGV